MKTILLSTAALLAVAVAATSMGPVIAANNAKSGQNAGVDPDTLTTKYPIKHLVVVFQENRSFDHYFGTYPNALNVDGEPAFKAAKATQTDINNLLSNPALLDNNPNLNPANGAGASNPFRLDRTQANTADQSHSYTPEQKAYDGGKVDLFPSNVGKGTSGGAGAFGTTGQVMGYFDGNTVTALWNYAQNYAMSDNAYGDQFGPSTPGAVNMFAGNTNGFVQTVGSGSLLADGSGGFTLTGDIDPSGDVCSSTSSQAMSTAKNIGDLLNAASVPWGNFYGGFNLQTINANGSTGCHRTTVAQVTGTQTDYVPHHAWSQYFASTANPTHARPTSTKAIGYTIVPGTKKVDPANHAYDLNDFFTAVGSGNFPAVSFIKMQSYQDAHPGNSDPLDEQTGIVNLVNFLQQQPDWDSTAVIIAYDDSDGWYDHVLAPTTSPSFSSSDALNGAGLCGAVGATEPTGVNGLPVAGRCGPGTRQPFLVISPYAKKNYVSHVRITQASIPQFIEDNWLNGQRIGGGSFDATTGSIVDMFNFNKKNSVALLLDPSTGTVDDKSKNKN
ncbi:MAG TPA: alkaline phosphatase family protein [Bradyrhizobium sp.]|nr:alkaline phosphatase family protein [Bradyrhizobium sp.]